MSKKFFFLCIASLMLTACSEKIEQDDNVALDDNATNTEQIEVTQNNTESNSETVQSTEISISTEDEEAVEVEETTEASNSSIDTTTEEKVTEKNEETVQTSLQPVDKDIDYYTYYETTAVVKNNSERNVETTTKSTDQTAVVYEQLSDDVIQLPLLQDNEVYFDKDEVQTISLAQLESINAVAYYEEPLTKGYLIDIDLSVLKEHYLGHSYSFKYEDVEYGVMIDEAEKEYGFIFLKDVEGLLEDIKKNGIFNILN